MRVVVGVLVVVVVVRSCSDILQLHMRGGLYGFIVVVVVIGGGGLFVCFKNLLFKFTFVAFQLLPLVDRKHYQYKHVDLLG